MLPFTKCFLAFTALAFGSAALCSAAPTRDRSALGSRVIASKLRHSARQLDVDVTIETEAGDVIPDPANVGGINGAINPGAQTTINSASPAPAEVTNSPQVPDQGEEEDVTANESDAEEERGTVTLPDELENTEEFVPTPIPDDAAVCFPSHATVEMEDGTYKKMEDIAVGDSVSVGKGEFSTVFMFTHKLSSVENEFVALESASGAKLSLTSGHFLYVNGELAPARTVTVGDKIELASGAVDTVENVGRVTAKGLFNPQTLHGDVVVNGIRASTYTTAIAPSLAHTLLVPLRALFESGVVRDPTFGLLEGGAGAFTSVLKAF